MQETHLVRLYAQNNVVQHGKTLHQLEVLMDHADAQRVGVVGVVYLYLGPILADLPFLRLVQAEQHRHEGGLACAVLTQKCMDLALF